MTGFPLDTVDSPSLILELLFDLKVRDVMSTDLITFCRNDSLRKIQESMRENGITGVPIVEDTRLVGLVSMDDIIRALADGNIDAAAESRMTRQLIVLEDDMPLSFAISYMEKYRYGRFPVLTKSRQLAGIITSRDIIVHLLIKMNKELEQYEEQRTGHRSSLPEFSIPTTSTGDGHNPGPGSELTAPAPQPEDTAGIDLEWSTVKFDFEHAGKASTEIKKLLRERFPDLSRKLVRRVAVASYELEMNQVVHSLGGTIRFTISSDTAIIRAADTGPGIANIEKALTEGFSTATDWIRSLGFGAGMGLPNTVRVADEFDISSSPEGTRVEARFNLATTDEP